MKQRKREVLFVPGFAVMLFCAGFPAFAVEETSQSTFRPASGASSIAAADSPELAFLAFRKVVLRYRSAELRGVTRKANEAFLLVRIPNGNDRTPDDELLTFCCVDGNWALTRTLPIDKTMLPIVECKFTSGKNAVPKASGAERTLEEEMSLDLDAMLPELNQRLSGTDMKKDLAVIDRKISLCRAFCRKYETVLPESSILKKIRLMQTRQEEMRILCEK